MFFNIHFSAKGLNEKTFPHASPLQSSGTNLRCRTAPTPHLRGGLVASSWRRRLWYCARRGATKGKAVCCSRAFVTTEERHVVGTTTTTRRRAPPLPPPPLLLLLEGTSSPLGRLRRCSFCCVPRWRRSLHPRQPPRPSRHRRPASATAVSSSRLRRRRRRRRRKKTTTPRTTRI